MINFQINAYNELDSQKKNEIDSFVCFCYNETLISSIHLKKLDVQSVQLYLDNQLIGYAGFFKHSLKNFDHVLVSISCFCVHPKYRHRSYGKILLQFLESLFFNDETIEFSLFTCKPSLSSFYTKNSHWKPILLTLVSSDFMNSSQENLIVLFQSFSSNIQANNLLEISNIFELQLPFGCFI